jgi:uncharacterized membrane protein YeaQ/YmgE (transglycosylase-associated protein family)
MTKLLSALTAGLALQIGMVVFGHCEPAAQQMGLFPVAGTIIGAITGWLAVYPGALVPAGARGAAVACVCGIVGSLVSTFLGDVPMSNLVVAGGATLVAGAIGGLIRSRFGRASSG